MQPLKFTRSQSEFFNELKTRVNDYFKSNDKKQSGDFRLYFKAILLISIFLTSYIAVVFIDSPAWISLPLCVVMGIAAAGIGFNVMHDGSHGSFSENKVLNRFAGLTLNFLGCSSFLWNIKHNVIHHTYTNVDGHDDDIENEPFMRMCPSQKHFGIHRFQHFYWPFIYGIMYVAWVFFLDVRKYFRRRISLKENIEIPVSVHIGFWLTKIIYTLIFVVIPITQVGFLPFLLGYSVFVFTTGVVISVIFQLAHCVEDLEFHDAHTIDKLDSDWATHQLATTANFATQSKIVSFFTGGLNYQIEHHLFPKISHVHYPEVSKIVRDVCTKYNITYFENRTLAGAVVSHVKFLRRMGRKN